MSDGLDWINAALNAGTYQNTQAAVELLEKQYSIAVEADARKRLDDQLVGLLTDGQSETLELAHRGKNLEVLVRLFRLKNTLLRVQNKIQGAEAKVIVTDLQMQVNAWMRDLLSNPDVCKQIENGLADLLINLKNHGQSRVKHYDERTGPRLDLIEAGALIGPVEKLASLVEVPFVLRDGALLAGEYSGTVKTIFLSALTTAGLTEPDLNDMLGSLQRVHGCLEGVIAVEQSKAEKKSAFKASAKNLLLIELGLTIVGTLAMLFHGIKYAQNNFILLGPLWVAGVLLWTNNVLGVAVGGLLVLGALIAIVTGATG